MLSMDNEPVRVKEGSDRIFIRNGYSGNDSSESASTCPEEKSTMFVRDVRDDQGRRSQVKLVQRATRTLKGMELMCYYRVGVVWNKQFSVLKDWSGLIVKESQEKSRCIQEDREDG